MLTKNFPTKKDARRRRALERMKRKKGPNEKLLEAIKNTERKLIDNPRTIRSKKTKKGKGK